jgi:hypothetical protein
MRIRKADRPNRHSSRTSLVGLATSRPARLFYIVAGTAGLIALTVALVGPKRIERTVYRPLRDAVEPRAEKLWADTQGVREQIAALLENVSPSGRTRLVSSLQSWIGRFTAR